MKKRLLGLIAVICIIATVFSIGAFSVSAEEEWNTLTTISFANLTVGDPVKEPQFKNIFAVHGVVSDIRDEVDKNEDPTGRTIVDAYIP